MPSKIGRPTDNPKLYKVTVRLDEEAIATLNAYCLQEHVERGEAMRRGIKKLKENAEKIR